MKEDTSLMDIEYLAHIDMWMHLGWFPELNKYDYMKYCANYPWPFRDRDCHACDITRKILLSDLYKFIYKPNCIVCPLDFKIPCHDDNSLWAGYQTKNQTIRSFVAFEIMMTPWKRK